MDNVIKATDIARRKLQARGARAFAEWIGASKQGEQRDVYPSQGLNRGEHLPTQVGQATGR